MNKFERLKSELETVGSGKMKAYGNSMLPILKSGSLLTFRKDETYTTGDIVFCKVNGRLHRCAQNRENGSQQRVSHRQ